jgi:TolB protein
MFDIEFKLRRLALLAVATLAFLQTPADAQLTIEITGAGANRIPVAIAEFGGDAAASRIVTSVIQRRPRTQRPVQDDRPWRGGHDRDFQPGLRQLEKPRRRRPRRRQHWRQCRRSPGGPLPPLRRPQQTPLVGSAFVTSKSMLRAAGHRIADIIYQKLTGEPGIFSTRVAYVVRVRASRYELHISDADGQNAQVALISKEPIISPSWSPDGSRLAYVPSRTRSRWSTCTRWPRESGSSWPTSRAPTRPPHGRPMVASWPSC